MVPDPDETAGQSAADQTAGQAAADRTAELLAEIQRRSFAGSRTAAAAWPEGDRMTAQELGRVLRRRYALAATTRPDGRPHVAPTGFVAALGRLWLPTGAGAVRVRNTATTPSLVLTLLDEEPHAFLAVEGGVRTVPVESGPVEEYQAKYGAAPDFAGCWFVLTPTRVMSYRRRGWVPR